MPILEVTAPLSSRSGYRIASRLWLGSGESMPKVYHPLAAGGHPKTAWLITVIGEKSEVPLSRRRDPFRPIPAYSAKRLTSE
jgi:hypothetical protein